MNKILFLFMMLSLFACKSKGSSKQTKDPVCSPKINSIDNNSESFSMELSSQGIVFKISVLRDSVDKLLSISTVGLKNREYNESFNIVGEIVVDAELSDLNGDGSPEILIYTRSVGSGSYGKVYAFSVNNLKSMSQVYIVPVYENKKLKQGYMGHDKFEVVGKTLVQQFPIYKDGDSNAQATGGVREVKYQLVDGEASRRLEPTEVNEIRE